MSSITAANATFMLSITGLIPVPIQLKGFAADDVFSTDPVVSSEVLMGVDGKLSGGFVFAEVKQSITLQADSDSNKLFDAWWAAQQATLDNYTATGIVNLRGITTKWMLNKGFLTSFPPIPDAKKLLQPRKYGITWESVSPAVSI